MSPGREAGRGRSRQRGLALIVVLWAGALMILLAASFAFSLRTEARLAGGIIDRAAAGAAAEAGLARLMAIIVSAERGGPGVVQGEMTFEGMRVSLSMTSENARVDLNAAPPALLEGLLEQAVRDTGSTVSARALADAVVDWRDADDTRRDHGAEERDYRAAGLEVRPRNGAFLTVSELAQVMGMEPRVFEFLEPLVTVYAWSPQVDPMGAQRPVLLALPGVSEEQVDGFLAARDAGEQGRAALGILSGAGRYLARSGGSVHSLVARATAPSGVSAARRAVVKLNAGRGQGLSVVAWFAQAPPEDKMKGTPAGQMGDDPAPGTQR
jgi:general secretion pathway protein K